MESVLNGFVVTGLVTDLDGIEQGLAMKHGDVVAALFVSGREMDLSKFKAFVPTVRVEPDMFKLTNRSRRLMGKPLAEFVDGQQSAVLLELEPGIGSMAFSVRSDRGINWICTEPKPFDEVFEQYTRLIISKTNPLEDNMFKTGNGTGNGRSLPETTVNVDPLDPAAQQTDAIKEMLESLMASGDFDATFDVSGRTLDNGKKELTGTFRILS